MKIERTDKMAKNKGIFFIVIASFLLGSIPLFAKVAFKGGLNSFTTLTLRFLGAAVILFIYIKKHGYSLKINRKQFLFIMLMGSAGYFLTSAFLFNSYKYISTGLATILSFVYPIVVNLFSIVIYKEKVNFRKGLALVLSIIGIYLLVENKSGVMNIKGVLLALSGGFAYAFYILMGANKDLKDINSFILIFYVTLVASLCAFTFSTITGQFHLYINLYSVVGALFLSLACTAIPLILFLMAVRCIGPSEASILNTLEPLVSIIIGAIILKEKIGLGMVIGTFLVILSIIIIAMMDKEKNSEKMNNDI
ncbi:DMT family transporter [Acidilutibacter cellobiosedens]|uniref:DMT family transporter n=1 Tax=Acidilutibacter cellobiosedens TaxID=2507161 RepID=A0A410QER3_9FIRM|nr:DMT family transporter [Acidilutibacter cellobiosedens]MBE6081665.1 DMT family transporter [Tissierellaceae bacterium]QAT62467.1 DMT family transporter [Acidilutibacter cellobiosedens]